MVCMECALRRFDPEPDKPRLLLPTGPTSREASAAGDSWGGFDFRDFDLDKIDVDALMPTAGSPLTGKDPYAVEHDTISWKMRHAYFGPSAFVGLGTTPYSMSFDEYDTHEPFAFPTCAPRFLPWTTA